MIALLLAPAAQAAVAPAAQAAVAPAAQAAVAPAAQAAVAPAAQAAVAPAAQAAVAVAAQAAPAAAPLLGPIGRQELPAKGCAAYLWSTTDRQLVAMAVADPATIRLSVGGKRVDLALVSGSGAGKLGFADSAEYRGGDVTARLTMDVVQQEGLTAGARVPTGSVQVDRPGQDGIVVAVAGLIGCRA